MLNRDLAELYKVKTKVFNQAVKRNENRFPDDFRFQLQIQKKMNWSQIAIDPIHSSIQAKTLTLLPKRI